VDEFIYSLKSGFYLRDADVHDLALASVNALAKVK
jgi:hypothetical protein